MAHNRPQFIGSRRMSALGQKRTCAVQLGMSALCQKRTFGRKLCRIRMFMFNLRSAPKRPSY